jgi:hypothetical protein
VRDCPFLDWLRRSWFRHPLSLRPDYGLTGRGWFAKGEFGLPRFYYDWDPGWHASNRRFLGFIWNLGPKILWVGLKDTN